MRIHPLLLPLLLCAPASVAAPADDCRPLETRPANVPEQKPAFEGQTRACAVKTRTPLEVTVLTDALEFPWAVEPLPDGALLVTEKAGRMRIVSADGQVGEPLAGLPRVDARGQGGLLDVALGPDFDTDRTIFWSYSEPREGGNATSVARGVLSEDRNSVDDVRVIFRAQPVYDGDKHFGSRLAFDADGMLLVTLGERSDIAIRPQAQHPDSHMGKIVRIAPDGAVPDDNPFVDREGTLPEIWAFGLRNVQAATFDANGDFWVVDHGARGGDEVNRIIKGRNYGWPLMAYGEEYSGQPIATAKTDRPGHEQPVYYWDPVIAPSGAQFHSGKSIPEWRGNLFTGGLKDGVLVRLVLEDGKIVGEEHLLGDRGRRIRDVREGADGALYVVTDEARGELWRVAPATAAR